ncbi:MAG: hypothetical protein ACRC1Z_05875, partial [Waterburya sp.]
MTLTLTQSDLCELYDTINFTETELTPSCYEVKGQIPQVLGKGQFWEIDLCAESWLLGETWQTPRDRAYISQEREHEVEFCLWIPEQNSNNRHSRYSFFGSGIAPQEIWQSPVNSPGFYVAISFEPDLLKTLYGNAAGELPPELKLLIKDNDWQKCWRDRTINSTM